MVEQGRGDGKAPAGGAARLAAGLAPLPTAMKLLVGTSGFAYKEWKGSFYPEELPAGEMLGYYSRRLPAVEINNTFYRLPRESVLARWAEETADGFTFVLKASRRITHFQRLKETDDLLRYLLETAAALGPKLGALLFQLPPNFKADVERLEAFLERLPPRYRAAFEFRHPSWHDEEVYAALRSHGQAALCIADTGSESDPPLTATAPWGYLRLRREEYGDAELAAWAARVREQPWEEVYVFFKHEDAGAGPRLAARFRELFEGWEPAGEEGQEQGPPAEAEGEPAGGG